MNQIILTACLIFGGVIWGFAGILKLMFAISASRGGDALEKFWGNLITLFLGGIGALVIFAPALWSL